MRLGRLLRDAGMNAPHYAFWNLQHDPLPLEAGFVVSNLGDPKFIFEQVDDRAFAHRPQLLQLWDGVMLFDCAHVTTGPPFLERA